MTQTHTETRKDGGAAYPVIPPCDQYGALPEGWPYPEMGMTLRDYFAGQALAGLMTQGLLPDLLGDYARAAYQLADAMLSAREGK